MESLLINVKDVKTNVGSAQNHEYGFLKLSIDTLPFNEENRKIPYELHNENGKIASKIIIDAYIEINDYVAAIISMESRKHQF